MKRSFKVIFAVLMVIIAMLATAIPVLAANEVSSSVPALTTEDYEIEPDTAKATDNSVLGDKALAAAIVVGIAAAAGAIGMGWAIAKSVEGISRQPEAEGKIRTTLMLGLVFVETAIIYALVIAILIIFVL